MTTQTEINNKTMVAGIGPEGGYLKEGDFVKSGSMCGQVKTIKSDGLLSAPADDFRDFTVMGTPEDPAALVNVYSNDADNWFPSETMSVHKMSELEKIGPLKLRKFNRESLETKRVPLQLKQEDFTEDENYYYFTAYASTFGNEDLGGDIIVKGAFVESLAKRKPKILGFHNQDMPVGATVTAYEDDYGLFVKGKIPKQGGNTQFIVPYLKDSIIDSMSIGFYAIDWKFIDGVRYIYKADLLEYSFVTFPMNPQAKVIGMKSINEMSSLKDLESFLRNPQPLSRSEAKTLISKFKQLSHQRDADDNESTPNALRDVAANTKNDEQLAHLLSQTTNKIRAIYDNGSNTNTRT